MRVAWQHLDPARLDFELSPSRSAKDPAGVLARHQQQTGELAKAADLVRFADIAYGKGDRQKLDLVRPQTSRHCPCIVFVHGGFWQEGSKAGSGFAARSFADHGWAHAGIGYSLAPAASLAGIIAEIGTALRLLIANAADFGIDPGRIVLAGHSAGGHLAAAVLAGLAGRDLPGLLAGYLPISGVFDLAPIAASYVNDRLGLAGPEPDQLSPLLYRPAADRPCQLVIGGDESGSFQDQTAALANSWADGAMPPNIISIAGRDHFDILDELADPNSDVFRAVLAMGARP